MAISYLFTSLQSHKMALKKANKNCKRQIWRPLVGVLFCSVILFFYATSLVRAAEDFCSLIWFLGITVLAIALLFLVGYIIKIKKLEKARDITVRIFDSFLRKSASTVMISMSLALFIILILLILSVALIVFSLFIPQGKDPEDITAVIFCSITFTAIFVTFMFDKIFKAIIKFFYPIFEFLDEGRKDGVKAVVDYVFRRDVFRLLVYLAYFVCLTWITIKNLIYPGSADFGSVYLQAFVVFLVFDTIYHSKKKFSFSICELLKKIASASRSESEK